MSYIDTFTHTNVGILCGLPIYHPLDNLDEEGFEADHTDLVLGGGSGEQAMIVPQSLAVCVYTFLNFQINIQEDVHSCSLERLQECNNVLYEWKKQYRDIDIYDNFLHCYSMEEVVKLHKSINKAFKVTKWLYPASIVEKLKHYVKKVSSEEKLGIMLGSIVHNLAQHLLTKDDRDFIAEFTNKWNKCQLPSYEYFEEAFRPAIKGWSCAGTVRQYSKNEADLRQFPDRIDKDNGVFMTHYQQSFFDEKSLLARYPGILVSDQARYYLAQLSME